jgi:hypothetical protein
MSSEIIQSVAFNNCDIESEYDIFIHAPKDYRITGLTRAQGGTSY